MCLLAGVLVCVFASSAKAQVQIDASVPDAVGAPTEGPTDNWRYTLGLGAAAVPDYEGSEDYKGAPLPIARAQKGFQYGQLFGSKVTSNLVADPNFRAGPVAQYISKRDDVDNNQVDNMKDVDPALMLGGLVGYDMHLNPGTLGFEVEWTHDVIDGNDGWLLQPEIKYSQKLAEDWGLFVSTSLTYASEDYMETYFSVTPADSARSGLPTFNASDGLKDVGVNLALTYNFTQNWMVGGLVGYKRLLNDAEDSPVTKVGDENQYVAGLFFAYSWQGGN
jgi:outer membrane scaffolding protein for murein synthesis (MipA/OmpV family)